MIPPRPANAWTEEVLSAPSLFSLNSVLRPLPQPRENITQRTQRKTRARMRWDYAAIPDPALSYVGFQQQVQFGYEIIQF